MTDIDTALDAVECLRDREREVEELPGGLTNVNLKVTTSEAHRGGPDLPAGQ